MSHRIGAPALVGAVLLALGLAGCGRASGPGAPLALERSYPLDRVAGRIDHLAFDPRHRRLFVAELGNGTIDAIDLATGKTERIEGLDAPQGLAWLDSTAMLAVACGGDGTVRFYDGETLKPAGVVKLGKDADNLRVDPATGNLVAGYGDGALAVIDAKARTVLRRIALPAHPEGFRIDPRRRLAFVNLPDAKAIAVVSLDEGRRIAGWPAAHGLNFPMALDSGGGRLAIGYRFPARLALIDPASGALRQDLPGCGDADDLFFDEKRGRLYMVCGTGKVDVFRREGEAWRKAGTIPTRSGARTGLFVPELDRLFVAARAGFPGGAAILSYAPVD